MLRYVVSVFEKREEFRIIPLPQQSHMYSDASFGGPSPIGGIYMKNLHGLSLIVKALSYLRKEAVRDQAFYPLQLLVQ